MLNIIIKTIPHSKQRYSTCGDWFWKKDGSLHIRVSDVRNWKMEFLIAFHELIEVMLCLAMGISQKSVDDFDIQYEEDRDKGLHRPEDEPGDDEEAPYRVPHYWATTIERILAMLLGVNWQAYGKVLERL